MPAQPPAKAIANGHTLEWDPPYPSSAERWTCTACGRAALRYCGNEYGSAVDGQCTGGEQR